MHLFFASMLSILIVASTTSVRADTSSTRAQDSETPQTADDEQLPANTASETTSGQPPEASSWWDGAHLSGRWGGGRDWLEERGFGLDLNYVQNLAGNPIGGRRQGITYTDNVHLGFLFDFDKMLGWSGARFTLSGLHRAGNSLTNDFIGNQFNVQQVFGGQTYMLYGLHLEQRLLSDKLSIKAGRFAASDDFNSSPVYGTYMNHGINGFVRNVQLNTQYSVYPFATWALRAIAEPTPSVNVRVGVYQNSPNVFNPEKHGADFSFDEGDGFLVAGQVGFTPRGIAEAGRDASEKTRKEPTGHYWVGTTVSRYKYARFDGEPSERLSYGFYAHADQLIWREQPTQDEGLKLWLAGGYYPQKEIAIVPVQVNGGALYKGLVPGRGDDVLAFGFVYGAFGSEYSRAVESASGTLGIEPSYEIVLELAYKLALGGFLFVQPDVQYVVGPAGTGVIDDTLVLGAQTGVNF